MRRTGVAAAAVWAAENGIARVAMQARMSVCLAQDSVHTRCRWETAKQSSARRRTAAWRTRGRNFKTSAARGSGSWASRTPQIEPQLLRDSAELEAYARALKQRGRGRSVRALRRLIEIQRTYPKEPFLAAVRQATHFGLYDLGRLEKLILQHVAGNFFTLNLDPDDDA